MTILHIAMATAAALTAGAPDQHPLFYCRTPQKIEQANVPDVYGAYGSRSVSIIKQALAGDRESLSQTVDSDAKFIIFAGDVGIGPRSKGIDAVVEFARQLEPRSYQFSTASAGPISMSPCGSVEIDLTFARDAHSDAVIATFQYQDGVLIGVTGSHIKLVTGEFP